MTATHDLQPLDLPKAQRGVCANLNQPSVSAAGRGAGSGRGNGRGWLR